MPQPVTFSIATAIYDMMPNGTDFSEFKAAGYKGLNFAMIEGSEHYHQPSDNLENLDKNTMWQYYQTMTALGTHFGNTNLKQIQHTQDAVYFPLPVAGIVMVPGLLGRILGFIPLLLALLLTIQTLRNKQLRPARRVVRIIGLLVLGLLPAAITVFLFAASYMVFIPALLFLLTDLCFGEGKGWRKWAGIAMFLLALLITALLFAPMAFFFAGCVNAMVSIAYFCIAAGNTRCVVCYKNSAQGVRRCFFNRTVIQPFYILYVVL
ncbi:MAG: M28 family peptidase [Oscillospiraceae bacterium]